MLHLKVIDQELGLVTQANHDGAPEPQTIHGATSTWSLSPYTKCKTAYLFAITADGVLDPPNFSAGYGPGVSDCSP